MYHVMHAQVRDAPGMLGVNGCMYLCRTHRFTVGTKDASGSEMGLFRDLLLFFS